MDKLRLHPAILILAIIGAVVNGDKNPNVTADVHPAALVNPDEKLKGNCQNADYRLYVECLLEESKRDKRQGYNNLQSQNSCSGNGCPSTNQQQCIGNGCLQLGQQQCGGNGCLRGVQQPCSGPGCVFFGYNCAAGAGSGCTQIGQTCYGVGCVPPCSGSSCSSQPERVVNGVADDVFRREFQKIREELGLVKTQNERLISATEKATGFILKLINRPQPEPRIVREPVLVGHNSTTNIDISNYLNNTNVVNVPEAKTAVQRESKTHCCTVVRPKTCRRTSRPPYFICGHKTHRTCGSHCSKKRVVYSKVKPGCVSNADEDCVSYHTTHPWYPTAGYYPPTPMYFGLQFYPNYAPPPQTPIYPSGPAIYQNYDPEEVEDCEGCAAEVEAEDCEEDADADCESVAKKDEAEYAAGLRINRDVPLGEISEVKKEAEAIKRSGDQLATSVAMLQEAVELGKLEAKEKKN